VFAMPYEVDRVGKLLFGRAIRLMRLIWIRRDAWVNGFYLSQAASELVVSTSAVSSEIGRLVELGMLRRSDGGTSDRRINYECVQDHPLWAVAEIAASIFD
jgi:hypothetical protein